MARLHLEDFKAHVIRKHESLLPHIITSTMTRLVPKPGQLGGQSFSDHESRHPRQIEQLCLHPPHWSCISTEAIRSSMIERNSNDLHTWQPDSNLRFRSLISVYVYQLIYPRPFRYCTRPVISLTISAHLCCPVPAFPSALDPRPQAPHA